MPLEMVRLLIEAAARMMKTPEAFAPLIVRLAEPGPLITRFVRFAPLIVRGLLDARVMVPG